MEQGPIEQTIAKQCYRQHQPLPERIQNAPQLRLGLNLYLNAFFDLDSERHHGMGLQRIPWSSIKDYALAFEFDEEQTDQLLYFVKRMDSANLEYLDSKHEKK